MHIKRILCCAFVSLLLAAGGCTTAPRNTAFQTSTIDALLAGVYDGEMTCADLLTRGDFGIGTFDALEGEMLVLDGEMYQVKADGKVYRPSLVTGTPFATVCAFKPETMTPVPSELDFAGIEKMLDQLHPNQNLFYAIRLDGTFKSMKTRSVPGQQKPYPPLKEVTKNQPEFEMQDVAGTIVGFRCPPFVKGINVPGYHLHFISNDRSQGGHILAFEIETATVQVDMLDRYVLTLPGGDSAFAATDLTRDRSAELHEVEK